MKDIIYQNTRRSGRTTRQVDSVIQSLFGGKKVTIIDHAALESGEPRTRMSQHLLDLILQRLYI